ncbi:polysaccharide deacetylase family protein [Anaerostipes sp.]|uniref:polysaccharide deacetylase family protein n=1 Tax=Anaerostipes sp. TaxID=1872530 RepID=UPI0025B808C8|nr:polysaccharide deacetylase family protein [Anaerostipes sp.]MBS7008969.1 polysaccharide deacetylase family protein [Anaerostipes sp.]
MSRARRTRRRWNKAGIAVWVVLLALIAAGGIWFIRSGKTNYTSVNDGIGEMMAKANEGVMDKDTGEELKDSLYVPRKIDKTKKLIAFSFDDGPARDNTDRIVKALEKNDARATFFMLGQNANLYPELVKEVMDSGNEVAGHSWNHPQLTKIGASGVQQQMSKMNSAISKVTGSDVGLLRPPYGAINDMVKANIDAPLLLWSIDTLDWKTLNTNSTVNAILKQAKDGDIVLMHDIHKPTVAAVEKVLPQLKAKGFEVCTVSELLEAKGIKVGKGDVVISANQINRYKK